MVVLEKLGKGRKHFLCSQSNNLFPRCIVCCQTPNEGILGGFRISGRFLCYACEGKIVYMQTGDSSYSLVVDRLKGIWG
ncbi:MAG: sigma factor G inhibitor Gin [Bacillota bacterium]